ncbi:VOC family protein [Nitrosovibrio sp. Nv17]|uniref:VOC family protein n=1 Tax=Nitrosovibrio sp. Nv17 TaxID=1855339 RepID=UPI0009086FAF|nr:VOC family protein [Nitrosovibrio sp. Nv17]SFW14036.1 Glyoxalase/Bleomycin resistance protein/Dioxygenase superfamily protein [Nitrosovibrio sp. Nv17]
MMITLDHTLVHATDPAASAAFLARLLDVGPPRRLGHFTVLQIGETSLDFLPGTPPIVSRHFAFRVGETAFDGVFGRIVEAGIPYWADPSHREPGRINRWDDGRGVYFDDPDGHVLEVLTRPYGSGGCEARHPHPLLDCPGR